jgi:glutamate dehydrogenase (NADP+)
MYIKTRVNFMIKNSRIQAIYDQVVKKNPNEPEFHQAVKEVFESLEPVVEKNEEYFKFKILERIVEPERIIMFKVPWIDDNGEVQLNRGYRVQFNSCIGPYKGGLRFHPSVYMGIIKFLGFEQIFKNSLTGLPMGGAKGGSDFDPKGKSDMEVMRFCQSFMVELYRHVGPNTDVPAGDIGVGGREIGYLFGMYRKIVNRVEGVLTGKSLEWGGSLIRPEATGYGAVFFLEEMLKSRKMELKGKKVAISGSGNVAQYAAEKLIQLGAKVVTLSDSDGSIYDPQGITLEKLKYLFELKNVRRGRIKEYAEQYNCEYWAGQRPWKAEADIAMPCATQNEIEVKDAEYLLKNKCIAVVEGANMPTHADAVKILAPAGVLIAPGKAANAGGVATSGLEMTQNSMRVFWSREEVEKQLKEIMVNIHNNCMDKAKKFGHKDDYILGANAAGFLKVAKAMLDQGV